MSAPCQAAFGEGGSPNATWSSTETPLAETVSTRADGSVRHSDCPVVSEFGLDGRTFGDSRALGGEQVQLMTNTH